MNTINERSFRVVLRREALRVVPGRGSPRDFLSLSVRVVKKTVEIRGSCEGSPYAEKQWKSVKGRVLLVRGRSLF